MEIRMLGPLEAHRDGRSVVPTAAKPRQVLALLAVQRGRVVTVPTLIEELWGFSPPRSALTTLQTYVLRLRRALGESADDGRAPHDILATRYGGYLLDIEPDALDVGRYDRLVAEGNRAMEAGDQETTSLRLGAALDLWRGPALVDVRAGMPLEMETTRLEESRLSVLETRVAADLELGRHRQLCSELAGVHARHPMHEGLAAHYVLALYRCGQQARALEVVGRLRDTLAEELGLDPSPELQRMQRAILTADPALDLRPTVSTVPTVPAARTAPHRHLRATA